MVRSSHPKAKKITIQELDKYLVYRIKREFKKYNLLEKEKPVSKTGILMKEIKINQRLVKIELLLDIHNKIA